MKKQIQNLILVIDAAVSFLLVPASETIFSAAKNFRQKHIRCMC